MRRPVLLLVVIGAGTILAIALLLQTPGSLTEALAHPLQAILGTREQLDATLLDVSENMGPVRAAGRRLLKPLGSLQLIRTYDALDPESKKR